MKNFFRILCFDDNKYIRDSATLVLSTTKYITSVSAFKSYENILQCLATHQPDVVLMDIDMSPVSGIEAVKIIRSIYPALPVMMHTGFEYDENVFASICTGANGYILKNAKMESLINNTKDVYEGGAPMTPVISRQVLNQFARTHPVNSPAAENENYNLRYRETM